MSQKMLNAPLVLITGATGWLGGRVVTALTEGLPETTNITRGGHRLRALVPAGEEAGALESRGVEVIRGDIRDEQARQAFFKHAADATLIHLAGIIHPRRVTDFDAINFRGSVDLVRAASRAGLRRAVIMSSNSPVGCNSRPDHRFDEAHPYNPYLGYGRSKQRMELALRDMITAGDPLQIVIIRAPWFYGPHQPPRQTAFFRMIRNGKFPIVGDGNNRRSMGYVDNLAKGLLLAAAIPQAAGEIFWIADETPYTMKDIVGTIRNLLREDFGMTVKERQPTLPALVGNVAYAIDASLQAVGLYNQKIHVLSELNRTIACDIGKAKLMLGYRPNVDLREGMRRSIEWCLKTGQEI